MGIGETITRLREAKRWSMGQLAVHADVSKGTISLIESGKTEVPAADTLAKIAEALRVSCDYLCAEAGWYTPPEHSRLLPPEVLELARVVDSYPAGPAREEAKKTIADIGSILSTLRERMDEEARPNAHGAAPETHL